MPSGLYATELTECECPSKVLRHSPVFASHILMVLSHEPLIIFVPSGLYATDKTLYLCPFKVLRHSPVFASHILMVPSYEPLIILLPSGLYATELTSSLYPSKVLRHFPVFASHILIVLSNPPLIIFVQSGLYATDLTQLECPSKVLRSLYSVKFTFLTIGFISAISCFGFSWSVKVYCAILFSSILILVEKSLKPSFLSWRLCSPIRRLGICIGV